MGVSENLIRLRKLSGLTQEEFGEIAYLTRSAVSQWEGGRAEPRLEAISHLSRFFGIRKARIVEDGGMDRAHLTTDGRIAFDDLDTMELSDDETQLVRLYRSADDRGRSTIMLVAEDQAWTRSEAEANTDQ